MRQTILLPALLAALASGPAAAHAALPAVAGLQLEICRLPGMSVDDGDQAIRIPAGTVFTAAGVDAGLAAPTSTAGTPPLRVILAAPATIDPAAFCVRAPISLPDPVARGAVRAELDSMSWVSSGPVSANAGPLCLRPVF